MMTNPKNRLAVIGNGPSLKGFDFGLLQDFDTLGMNVAYRYWDKIDWYPDYYACLDVVVGMSHLSEIRRLILDSERNGIKMFLLRENVVKALGNVGNLLNVISFEDLHFAYELFRLNSITTGSHSLLWGALMGYKEIVLLGIDCNYEEKLSESQLVKGAVLEITEEVNSNPNYFFNDYQKVGDRYHVPNPSKDLHVDCWREAAAKLSCLNVRVINANTMSNVDAFQFSEFKDIENSFSASDIKDSKLENYNDRTFDEGKKNSIVVGPYSRKENASLSEDRIVSYYFVNKGDDDRKMIDVGIHHGSAMRAFAKRGWHVIGFEPDSKNRSVINEVAKQYKNVVIDNRAISDNEKSNVSFYASTESTGISSLEPFTDGHQKSENVEVTTLRNVIDEYNIKRIDYLKIDTEGFDLFVLKGMDWGRIKPEVIQCEFEDFKTKNLGYDYKDLGDLLLSKGYQVFLSEWHPVIRYGISHDWCSLKTYPCELSDNRSWGNMLAFKVPVDVDDIAKYCNKGLLINNENKQNNCEIKNKAKSKLSKITYGLVTTSILILLLMLYSYMNDELQSLFSLAILLLVLNNVVTVFMLISLKKYTKRVKKIKKDLLKSRRNIDELSNYGQSAENSEIIKRITRKLYRAQEKMYM